MPAHERVCLALWQDSGNNERKQCGTVFMTQQNSISRQMMRQEIRMPSEIAAGKKNDQGKLTTTSFSMSRSCWGTGLSKNVAVMLSSENVPVRLNER